MIMRYNDKYNYFGSQPFKWLVALVIFMLVMGFTTANVFGFNVPPAKFHGGGQNSSGDNDYVGAYGISHVHGDPGDSGDVNPESVPEPGTIILLATGLGAAYGAMRRKTK